MHDLDDKSGQLQMEGTLYILFIFYKISNILMVYWVNLERGGWSFYAQNYAGWIFTLWSMLYLTGRQVILIIGVALHLRYFIDIYREFLDLWLTENLTTIQSLNNSPFADVALIKILPILSFR